MCAYCLLLHTLLYSPHHLHNLFFSTNIHSDGGSSGKSGKGSSGSGKSGKASVDEKDDGWNGGGVITKAESEMKFSQSNINSASALRIAVPLVAAVVGGAVTLL